MVHQVRTVSILMIIQGSLTALVGLLYAALGPAMFALMQAQSSRTANPADETVLRLMLVFYLVMGLALVVVGALNIFAGIRCLSFRGRTFAIVALFGNILPVFTGYCAPTSIGMLIYGLIVLFNGEVAAAFAAGGPDAWDEDRHGRRRRDRYDRDDRDRADEDRDDDRDEGPAGYQPPPPRPDREWRGDEYTG